MGDGAGHERLGKLTEAKLRIRLCVGSSQAVNSIRQQKTASLIEALTNELRDEDLVAFCVRYAAGSISSVSLSSELGEDAEVRFTGPYWSKRIGTFFQEHQVTKPWPLGWLERTFPV